MGKENKTQGLNLGSPPQKGPPMLLPGELREEQGCSEGREREYAE